MDRLARAELLRIVKTAPWRKGTVIQIPLVPHTRDEPRITHLHHVWLEHLFGKGLQKV